MKMDYDLTRIDYTICGITFPGTVRIIPASEPKLQQKFTIGDKNGVLQCLTIKDEEPVVQFKTLPGKPITSVQLAATTGTQTDKIFAASGNEVKGYTKKGKVFLAIETALTETITSMCVLGADLILCSGRTVTYYRDLQEFYSYVCEDRVLDIAAFAAPNSARVRLLVLIANKGAAVLEGGQLLTRITISSGPTRLIVPTASQGSINAFYGAADGSIGLITYDGSVLSSQSLVESKGFGAVVCLGWFYNNGATHLAVGRHDGTVQLYLTYMENLTDKPRLKFTYICGEPVTAVEGGCVGTVENELLVATFSGRIFALRSSRLISGASALANIPHEALAARRSKLEIEIARLEKQVANERDKYQRSTRSLQAGLSTPPLLDLQHELYGATREGWQEVQLMSAVPLDMLFIYCRRKIEMHTDTAAVLSICPPQAKESDLLATVRCQAGTRRLWVRMRTVPDRSMGRRAESVKVLIYALPAGAPRVARLLTLQLPALPYYSQHEDPDLDKVNRSWGKLRVSGSFSVAEMTSWLTEILPRELPRPATNVIFGRRHTLLGTILVCQYQRGSASFKSDNISTVAVIKNILSDCSVKKSIRIEIMCDIPEDCCLRCFERIEEQFIREYHKNKDITLKRALRHLDLDSNSKETYSHALCKDYLKVWEMDDSEDNTIEYFDELVDTITEWYADWKSLSLHTNDTYENIRMLRETLKHCQIEDVKKILKNESLSPQDYYRSKIF